MDYDKWIESAEDHSETNEKLKKAVSKVQKQRKEIEELKFKVERLGVQYARAVEKIEHLGATRVSADLANKYSRESDQKSKVIEELRVKIFQQKSELRLASLTVGQSAGWAALSMGDSIELHKECMRKLAKEKLNEQCIRDSSTQTEKETIIVKEKVPEVDKEKLSSSTGKTMEQLTKRKERKKRNKERRKLGGIIKNIEKESKKEILPITEQYRNREGEGNSLGSKKEVSRAVGVLGVVETRLVQFTQIKQHTMRGAWTLEIEGTSEREWPAIEWPEAL